MSRAAAAKPTVHVHQTRAARSKLPAVSPTATDDIAPVDVSAQPAPAAAAAPHILKPELSLNDPSGHTADILTKVLPPDVHARLAKALLHLKVLSSRGEC